jgi:hypothetical protein
MHRVEDALHRLSVGLLHIPEGVDPGEFIVRGGVPPLLPQFPRDGVGPSLTEAVAEYLDNLGHLAESNRSTVAVHLGNLTRELAPKADAPIRQI